MFEKQKLSMHFGSSKRYAIKIKHLVSDLKGEFDDLNKFNSKFKEAVKLKNIDDVEKVFDSFLEDCLHSENDIKNIKEGEFIIEHRLIKHLRDVEEKLSEIRDSIDEKFQKDMKDDYEQLEKVFGSIINSLKKEKLKARDLKRDIERLRDKTILPNAMIFHILKIAARHEKGDIKKEKKEEKQVLDEIHEILILEKKDREKISPSIIKKLAKNLKRFESSIIEELKEALKMEDELIVISFRLQDLNREELEKLHAIAKIGFPIDYIKEADAKEKDFFENLNDEQREDYKYARALLGESKDLT